MNRKKDFLNRLVEQLLGYGGSFTDAFAWDRVGSIYGQNNDITSSSTSTSITPCHIEGVCKCM